MPSRRRFIRNSIVAGAAVTVGIRGFAAGTAGSAAVAPGIAGDAAISSGIAGDAVISSGADGLSFTASGTAGRWPTVRPAPRDRKFRSKAVEETIKEIESFLGGDNELS